MLAPGTRLGPYEIIASLGAGGMGEVYRARDARLARDLALKVLPPHLAGDDARRRFEQEARAASALSHPNIVTIFDVGESDGVAYLAMELIEGRTLRELLTSGALPVKPLLHIAVQLAHGLTAAHGKGIVHRDLKPENVIVADTGIAKILDFGLAKAGALSSGHAADTVLVTQAGAVVGTAGYMSPEQARGETIDHRSDQFSFGAIVYEMATGRRAFARRSIVETAAAVINDEPEPLERSSPQLPPPLLWAIERCLAKRPHDRYETTADLHRDLVAVSERLSDVQATGRGPLTNLPHFGTSLVGRRPETEAVAALLAQDTVRLLTLTGPGGVGKTRLAVHVAAEIASRFPGGVTFIPLASIADWRLVASAIATALGVRPESGESPEEALTRTLKFTRAPLLLVIDNFEHVCDAAGMVSDVLDASPVVTVLVTSRSVLHVYGEHEYPVPPLALPERRHGQDAPESSPAVALFVQRAIAARPDFRLSADHAPAVIEICRRLDGLPMAIELAAARIKLLPPAALLARLEGRLLSLAGGARDRPARQQTLRSAIDWSHDLLAPEEQRLFRRLSVFVGGWTLESAEAVCDATQDLGLDILDGLASLVDKSLVQRVETGRAAVHDAEPRFVMLETMREYGLERLDEAGDTHATRRAHAAYTLVIAGEGATLAGAAQLDWLSTCDREHANLSAALRFLTEARAAEWGLRIATSLFQYWHVRGHLVEGRDRLLALLELPEAAAHAELCARARFQLGAITHVLGDYAGAIAVSERAHAEFSTLGNARGRAMTANGLGIIHRDDNDLERALGRFNESIASWREIGDRHAEALTMNNLAPVALAAGDSARARQIYQECRRVFRDLHDDSGVAWTFNHEADAAIAQGEFGDARTLLEDAFVRFERLHDDRGVGYARLSMGHVKLDEGDTAGARALYAKALEAYGRIGDPRATARVLEAFARAAAIERDGARALTLAGAAAALRQAIGARVPPAERAAFEQQLEPARTAAGATAAWMRGWSMSAEEASRFATADAT